VGPYDLGGPVPPGDLAFYVTDGDSNPVNASVTPVLTITLPDGTTATPAVSNVALGTYQPTAEYVTTQAGHHLWAWLVAGTYPAAYADSFEVRPSPDPTITSLAEEREILKIPDGNTSYDSIIRGYSQAITEWIEYVCGPVVTQEVTEVVRAQGRVLILSKPPIRTDLGTTLSSANRRDGSTTNGIVSITPVLSYGFMYDLDQLLTDGPRGIVRHLAGLPFFYSGDPYSQFEVAYWAGRKVIPWGIYEAHKIALKHVFAVERGGLSSAAPASYGEQETTPTGFGFAVPTRAVELLTPHAGKASKAAIA
jgi:hypothetical protein